MKILLQAVNIDISPLIVNNFWRRTVAEMVFFSSFRFGATGCAWLSCMQAVMDIHGGTDGVEY